SRRAGWAGAGGGGGEGAGGGGDPARPPGVRAGRRAGGRARLNVGASGRDGRVNGWGKVIGERLALAGLALGGGTADVLLDDNALKGELALPEARIAASAQGRLDGVIATRATVTDFEIGAILRPLLPALFPP